MAKLLIEQQIENISCEIVEEINESTGIKQKNYSIQGIFLQGNVKNHNGRIYDPQILAKECERYNIENIAQNRAFGELSHPDSPNIGLDRVSHLIKELRREGDNFYGRAKVIDTPNGKIVKTLMDEGAKFGVSSRGTGSLSQYGPGIMSVGADYRLATIDIVSNPSGPDCWVENILENKEFFFDPGVGEWFPGSVEKLKKTISGMSVKKLEEQKLQLFEQYLEKLSKAIV